MRIQIAVGFLAIAGFAALLSSRGPKEQNGLDHEVKLPVPADYNTPSDAVSTPVRFRLPELDEVKLLPIATELEFLNSTDARPEDDIELLAMVFSRYRKAFGQHPVGTNEEIVAALAGRNAKEAALISPENKAIDEKGRLLDRWGTPYFFHQQSGDKIEIVSAGPDQILHNEDDVVLEE